MTAAGASAAQAATTSSAPAGENGLDPSFAQAIQALIAASGGRLYIQSGYRSDQEQQQLFDAAVQKYGSVEAARKWVAPPGKSNHNRGMAVDLGGDTALAHTLAPRFGLVFPMSWEPWHIEPVHARDSSSPDAYTDPPPGQQNPTTDQSLSSQPDWMAATLANAMKGAMDPTVVGTVGANAGATVATPVEGESGQMASQGGAVTGGGGPVSVGKDGIAPPALYAALIQKGLSPAMAAAGVAIAGRESSYSPAAHNDNANTGDDSYGLFQVNLLNGGWTKFLQDHGMSDPASALRTAQGSIDAFAWIAGSSGLNPWGGYKGANWYDGTNLDNAVAASGGKVTLDDLQGLK